MMQMNYICAFCLIVLGMYCMIAKKNMLKTCIGMGMMDYGVNLMIVSVGFHEGGTAPIFTISELSRASFFVDPVPQALTLTSIVIGAGTTALALSLAIMAKKQYGTVNTEQIGRAHV